MYLNICIHVLFFIYLICFQIVLGTSLNVTGEETCAKTLETCKNHKVERHPTVDERATRTSVELTSAEKERAVGRPMSTGATGK